MLLFRCQIFHSSPERLLKSLLGIILLVHFTAFCPHGGQLFRVFNGVLQQDSQLLRVNMANIRRKIEETPGQPQYIFTEVGVGYRMREGD